MKLNRNHKTFACALAFAVLCSGCGGISGSRSVSPATFLMPGLLQVDPKTPSFEPVPPPQPAREVAQVR